MEKEFVTYEQALALNELGFNEKCLATYHKELHTIIPIYAEYTNQDVIKAPLKQQAFKFFREKYDLSSYIFFWLRRVGWGYDIPSHSDAASVVRQTNDNTFTTYEEAENACIDKLILIVKQQDK